MIKRYADKRNAENWSLLKKFERWQDVELAVIRAREQLGRITAGVYSEIKALFQARPIDVQYIEEQEKVLDHDLASFIAERKEALSNREDLKIHVHSEGMTSYDDEEPAFAMAISTSCEFVLEDAEKLGNTIKELALRYRYLPKYERTHGQGAEVQSFGRCCLAWFQDLEASVVMLERGMESLKFSKLSGMIGSNSSMDPELEREALGILGFKPWHGATQIMSRVMYTPVSDALASIASVIEKISFDIWLGSRSGRPLWHEPFKRKQKGSSTGPHKKNPIKSEQNRGMGNMARSDAACIKNTIVTPEGRDISQSCVERVKWPDLFDETLRAIKNLKDVLSGLEVYPDNMLLEIIESRGTYAASTAKEVLAKLGLDHGLTQEDAYRIVQVASHNVFAPLPAERWLRENIPGSLNDTDVLFGRILMSSRPSEYRDIELAISTGSLEVCPELDFDEPTIERWNLILKKIFASEGNPAELEKIFSLSYILKNEAYQFKEVFGV
jgi:adenylosuccinate lyase